MPQVSNDSNSRLSVRIGARDKALIMRAAALRQTNLTEFVLKTAVEAAREVIDRAERIELNERDSARLMELLENPPPPTASLRAAAKRLKSER